MVEDMVKKYVTGLVVGKFCPLHMGHISVIRTALDQCGNVVILSYTSEDFPHCSEANREEWLKQATAEDSYRVRIAVLDKLTVGLGLTDDSPDDEHRKFCAQYILNVLDTTVQAVFTSEEYGQGFANYLGLFFTSNFLNPVNVEHVMVDLDRKQYPVSGTACRESLKTLDDYVLWYVKKNFVRRVLFLGAESTGKTSLVMALGNQITYTKTRNIVLEYGRQLWDERKGFLKYEDMAMIGQQQVEMEDAHAAGVRVDEFLYCDTSPMTTKFYSQQWFGRVSQTLEELIWKYSNSYYKVFLCAPDFPMIQDGTRQDESFRTKGHAYYLKELSDCGIEYTMLTGTLTDRVVKVKEVLSE
jgi:HTH-type transcriptional repressor of NAD biosynthesis genes